MAFGCTGPTSSVWRRGEEVLEVGRQLAFTHLANAGPGTPDAGEEGERAALVEGEPDITTAVAIATSNLYQRVLPQSRLNTSLLRNLETATTRRGFCLAAGVGGAILGRGADVIIVDDPI